MSPANVMLDLETLGTGYNAAIVAIGACRFDPYGAGLPEDDQDNKFYSAVDVGDAMKHGVITPSTLKWWLKQSDAARASTFPDRANPLYLAIHCFNCFVTKFGTDVCVWGNGATFDNVVIRSAFEAVGVDPGWSFRNDKCYRTVINLPGAAAVPFVRSGNAHNALDDAITQALHLQKVYKALGFVKSEIHTAASVGASEVS